MKGLESKSYEDLLRVMWVFNLEKRRLGADLPSLCNYLKGGCSQVEAGLFSQAKSDKMRGNSLELHQVEFNIGTYFFLIKWVVKHWNWLPRGVVESPSLQLFKNVADVALEDVVKW